MDYFRNPDETLQNLEAQFLALKDAESRDRYLRALHQTGQHPYWFQVRELMPRRDSPHYESATWETRPVTYDKHWRIQLQVPMLDGTIAKIWLGEIVCQESQGYLRGSVTSYRNLNSIDQWVENAENHVNSQKLAQATSEERRQILDREIARANWALSQILRGTGLVFNYKALINLDGVPLTWDPTQLLSRDHCTALNSPGHELATPDPSNLAESITTRPFDSNAQGSRSDDPWLELPDENFYLLDYLLEQFMGWLAQTVTAYGSRLRSAIIPLGPQLPTLLEGRWIAIYYWKVEEGTRGSEHYYYYDLDWYQDSSARFWRHDNDIGCADWGKGTAEGWGETPEIAMRMLQQRLKKKIDGMTKIAEKYGYHVLVEEKELPPGAPKRLQSIAQRRFPLILPESKGTWNAGMRYAPESGKE